MKKKHIIIIILAVLVLAGLFTIYKLPVKDSEAIDLDSDVTIIINSTGLNYIDGKAYPKIDKMKTANGQDLVRLDFEFHVGLIECTENPLLITVSRPVAELYIKSMSNVIENADEMIREKLLSLHTSILDNLVNQDETASTDSFNQHYDLVENRLGGIH